MCICELVYRILFVILLFRINEVNLLPRVSDNIESRKSNQKYVYFWCLIWSYWIEQGLAGSERGIEFKGWKREAGDQFILYMPLPVRVKGDPPTPFILYRVTTLAIFIFQFSEFGRIL